jgi:hypothetical protein
VRTISPNYILFRIKDTFVLNELNSTFHLQTRQRNIRIVIMEQLIVASLSLSLSLEVLGGFLGDGFHRETDTAHSRKQSFQRGGRNNTWSGSRHNGLPSY